MTRLSLRVIGAVCAVYALGLAQLLGVEAVAGLLGEVAHKWICGLLLAEVCVIVVASVIASIPNDE